MGVETFARVWHPVTRETVTGHNVTRLNVPFMASDLGEAGAFVAESGQALDDVGVHPSSEAAGRHLPGPAVSQELSFLLQALTTSSPVLSYLWR